MQTFHHSGLIFPVVDSGPADGEQVVMLHGFPQDHTAFDGVAVRLNAAGLRTLVPTLRGYPDTARPSSRRDYRMSELAADVVALIEAADSGPVHLVGHDWGGGVAWALAGWRPDLVRTLTVLSTPHPRALQESLVRSSQARKSWYMAWFQLPAAPELLLSRNLTGTLRRSGLPPEMAARYGTAMSDRARLTGALNWYRGLPFSIRPAIGDISVPTTYVWGRHDFALGPVAAERTAAHVNADYRFLILDAGHWLPELCAAEVADAVLDRVSRSA